jgi:hypothetical protein
MTIVFVLLAVILMIGVSLALELLRFMHAAPKVLDAVRLSPKISEPETYRPMARLFSREDVGYLSSRPGFRTQMLSKLRRSRSAIMSRYLRQIHVDFQRTWSLCRLLAPVSHDPDFSALLVRQFIAFHGLYFLLQARCLVGYYGYIHLDVTSLVEVLARLRQGAERTLRSTNAPGVAAF